MATTFYVEYQINGDTAKLIQSGDTLMVSAGDTISLFGYAQSSDGSFLTLNWIAPSQTFFSLTSDSDGFGASINILSTASSGDVGTILIQPTDGSSSFYFYIEVSDSYVAVDGISISDTELSMQVGDTYQLYATVSPSNATDKSVTWYDGDTSIASVDSNGLVTANGEGDTYVFVVPNSDTGIAAFCNISVSAAYVGVTSVEIYPTTLTLEVGETYQMTATVKPDNATNKNVIWMSGKTSVATVSDTGLVRAVAAGSTSILVYSEDNSATLVSCALTVVEPQATPVSMVLSKSTHSMLVGETVTLTATVTLSDGTTKTDSNATWTTSSSSIASVSKGVVTAKSAGTVTITATCSEDSSIKAYCTITIKDATVSVTGVSLNKTTLSLALNSSYTLVATVTPTDATNQSVTWSTGSSSIATVSSSGVVTAVGKGSTYIYATTVDGNYRASCKITVIYPVSVSVNPSTVVIGVDSTKVLTATVTMSDGTTNNNVAWSSTSSSVASISNGTLTGVGGGTVTINASALNDTSISGTCSVTVISITLNVGIDIAVEAKKSVYVIATVMPTTLSDTSVFFSFDRNSEVTTASGIAQIYTSNVQNEVAISGLGVGSVTLYVISNYDNSIAITCTLTVTASSEILVTSVVVSPTKTKAQVGDVFSLTAAVSPSNASISSVLWESSDTNILTVTQNGFVTCKHQGFITVTATAQDGSGVYGSAVVVIQPKPYIYAKKGTALDWWPATPFIYKSDWVQAQARIYPFVIEEDIEPIEITVTTADGAEYGFELNDNGYYESTNAGVNSSASVSVVTVTVKNSGYTMYVDCVNNAEPSYDFGIISNLGSTLGTTYTEDTSTTVVKQSFKTSSYHTDSVQTISYGELEVGTYTFYVKYRKDSSQHHNNDSFQFAVRFEKA